jgi:hypothetical protein
MEGGECVRCGHRNVQDVDACRHCGWPFTLDAWEKARFPLRRLSLDTNCVNALQKNPDLNALEHWARLGRIVLERSDAFLDELKGMLRRQKAETIAPHQPVWRLGVVGASELGVNTFLAGPDLQDEISEALFPTTAELTDNQERDVEHLRSHVITGADAFVTIDGDFFLSGKQELLRKQGIWVFTPTQAVQFLRGLYGWDA